MIQYISLHSLILEKNMINFYHSYTHSTNLNKKFKYKVVEQILTQFVQQDFLSLTSFHYVNLLIKHDPILLVYFLKYFDTNNLEDETEEYQYFIQQLIINFKPNVQQFLFLCKISNPFFFHLTYINNKEIQLSNKQKIKFQSFFNKDKSNISHFSIVERLEIEKKFGFQWTFLLISEQNYSQFSFLDYYKSKIGLCLIDQVNVILLRYCRNLQIESLFQIFDYTFNLFPESKVYLTTKKISEIQNILIKYEEYTLNNELINF